MRRKNRKWAAAGVGLYLFVMWSAYHWATHQGVPEGNLFVKIEREGVRRQNEERARTAAEELLPTPTGEARLNAAAPAYVAARYDAAHVVFIVTEETESRFASSHLGRAAHPTRVSAPARQFAPLAGLQELWEPDAQAVHFFPEIVQRTKPGEQWLLSVAPGSTIPVAIDRVVTAPMGCSLALGFLASVPENFQKVLAASGQEYFAVRRIPVELAQPAVSGKVGEISDWKGSPDAAKQIQLQLSARMKEELGKIDARLVANAASPGVASLPIPVGDARPRLKEWLHADRALQHGDGVLEYDTRAFRLSPDGATRLFVRARWTLAGATAFLMTAWFRVDGAGALALLWTDASWAEALREGEAPVSLGDQLDFQSVLNEFDADQDGWAELLVHAYDARPVHRGEAGMTSIGLCLYTDAGLVPLKQALRRELKAPEACLDP